MLKIIYFVFFLSPVFANCAEFNIDLESPFFGQESIFNLSVTGLKTFAAMQYITAHGLENLQKQLSIRQGPVITFANHQSEYDDPIIWAPLDWYQLDVHSFRWVLAAREQMESNWALNFLSSHIKVIRINRQSANYKDIGLHQEAMVTANNKLAQTNSWLHIFPEAAVYQDYGRLIAKFKPGLAHLIMSCDQELSEELNQERAKEIEQKLRDRGENDMSYFAAMSLPILVPVAHFGMHNVKPNRQGLRAGNQIHIFYGEPINVSEIINYAKKFVLAEDAKQRLHDMREYITTCIETQYLNFYLKCFKTVYGQQPEIYSSDNGYFHDERAVDLAELSKNILYNRSKIAKFSDEEKKEKYQEEMQYYIALLEQKKDFINFVIKKTKLSDYDNERISYNLYGVDDEIKIAQKKLSDWHLQKSLENYTSK